MKTVFIPIFSGIEGKNILRSGIYEELSKKDVRIVFFVGSHARAEYYRKENSDPRVRFEVIKKYRRKPLDRLFSFLKHYGLRTKTIDLKRRTHLEKTGNSFRYAASFAANRFLGIASVRTAVRFLDAVLVRDSVIVPYFEKHKPDLVFLADLFDDTECSLLREAKRRKIPTVGFISTWDRATSRWMIRLLPEKLIVFNEVMREEAVAFVGMPREDVCVSGAIQLDYHIKKPPKPRADVLESLGLSPETKLVVYGPLGRSFDATKKIDDEMIALLNAWVETGAFGPGEYKILVRFPPNDFIEEKNLLAYPHVIYDHPGTRFASIRGQDWDMRSEELDRLRDLLSAASLVVCYYSSLSIDAAVFDKPVININFYPNDEARRHPYYETTHYSKVAALGGIRLVESRHELLRAVQEYLRNPALDSEKRKQVVNQQAWRLDGKTAERIAAFVSAQW